MGNRTAPVVDIDADVKEVIIEIGEKMVGATAVMKQEKLCGVVTDGDLRRMLSNTSDLSALKARDVMSENPKQIDSNILASEALKIMHQNSISQLLVTTNGSYSGIIHLHDLLNEGLY
jgi:arabinose-5-phosphate isomerase